MACYSLITDIVGTGVFAKISMIHGNALAFDVETFDASRVFGNELWIICQHTSDGFKPGHWMRSVTSKPLWHRNLRDSVERLDALIDVKRS